MTISKHVDAQAMIERNRAIYAEATASVKAFGDAVTALPNPPWNTLGRSAPAAPGKRPETPRNRPE